MKFTTSLLSLAFAAVLFTGCKETATESTPANSDATEVADAGKLQTASFHIDGMTCAMGCARTIEKKLAELEGVKNAKVDFEKKSATVEYDAAKQTPEKLIETVEATADGKTYKVSDLKNSGDQAMVYKEKEKEKEKKKKKKKDDASTEKKEGCSSDAKPAGGCCSAKKAASSCHTEKATM